MGFALGIRYLCSRVMATHPADRERAEWPVHPDRVFMALAAAHFETGEDANERAALKWLERQPPRMLCSLCELQSVVTSYVPVNDTSAPRIRPDLSPSAAQISAGLSLLPEKRSRQPRQFPVAIPDSDTVYLIWDETLPEELTGPLRALCKKVTYLGHSASLVQMWLGDIPSTKISTDKSPGMTRSNLMMLHPHSDGMGRFRLRVSHVGRLAQLESSFRRGQRPPSAIAFAYGEYKQQTEESSPTGSHFSSDLIVLRQTAGPRFGLESTQLLAHHLRNTIMSRCRVQPLPEWLTGHAANNGPTQREGGHMALIPLPHVGRQHADGHLLGMAIVLPNDVPRREGAFSLHDLLFNEHGWPEPFTLRLGGAGECVLQLDEVMEARQALTPDTWTTPSNRWATVTPICLDRHPRGDNYWRQVEQLIGDGCQRIDLPRPATVIASPSPMFAGAPHTCNMPRLIRRNDGGTVQHTHAVILFDTPVRGPIILGAGRYRGYGLCRPLLDKE